MDLYFWGANSHFQSGTGIESEQFETPIKVDFAETDKIAQICGGGGHTIILTNDGRVFTVGWNNKGQCGVPKIEVVKNFTKITDGIRLVRCGWDVSCLISSSNDVFMMGNNQHEQFGVKNPKMADQLLKVNFPEEVSDVSFGLRHTAVLTKSGKLWLFGKSKCVKVAEEMKNHQISTRKFNFNEISYLEMQFFEAKISQISSGQHFTLIYTENHKFFLIGENKHASMSNQEIQICPNPVQEISSGWTHAAILDKNGVLYTFGRNNYHQLGRKSLENCEIAPLGFSEKLKKVICGSEHTISLTESGKIFTWGWNEHGNCGVNGTENVETPTQVPLKGKCELIGAGCGFCFALLRS
ncbi:secretion-regulating guanine nucleotide exchange factor [Culicoides brevitarsis]|uniref:secretion-regulating guanine nucleotide exchange factor n=1 Tax=Culicoides brevitarsis TaxID=469753 RepID=UPI00307BA57D